MDRRDIERIDTARLHLRPFAAADVAAYARIRAQVAVVRYLPGGAAAAARAPEVAAEMIARFQRHWREHGYGPWAVILRASGQLIGHNGLRHLPELGQTEVLWAVDEGHWGQGYASEAAAAARDVAFDRLGIDPLIALTLPHNAASRRVMARIGLRHRDEVAVQGVACVRYVLERSRRPARAAPTWQAAG